MYHNNKQEPEQETGATTIIRGNNNKQGRNIKQGNSNT